MVGDPDARVNTMDEVILVFLGPPWLTGGK